MSVAWPRATALPSAQRTPWRTLARWVLAAFVFTIPLEELLVVPGIGSVARAVGLVALPIGFLALISGGKLRLRAPLVFVVAAAGYVAWNVLSTAWSIAPAISVTRGMTLVQLLAFVWLVTELGRRSHESRQLMQAFVLGNLVAFGFAAYHVLVLDSGFRNLGNFDPNDFATLLAYGIPMAALLLTRRRSVLLHWVNLAYPFVAVLGVVLGASRGGLIVCLVALAVVPFSLAHLDAARRFLLLAATVIAVWAGFWFAPQLFPELFANVQRLSTTADEIAGGTLTERTLIWDGMLETFRESPLVGVGAAAGPVALADTSFGRWQVAHNAFLGVAVDTGFVGLGLFVLMLLLPTAAAFLANRSQRPFLLVLAATLVVGMMPLSLEATKGAWLVMTVLAVQRPIVIGTAPRRAG